MTSYSSYSTAVQKDGLYDYNILKFVETSTVLWFNIWSTLKNNPRSLMQKADSTVIKGKALMAINLINS